MQPRIIAVAGGTGVLGSPVAAAFMQAGWEVRILSRTANGLAGHIQIDISRPATLLPALEGCTALYLSLRGETAQAMQDVEVSGTAALIKAALAVGVGRIGHISGAGMESADPRLLPVAVKQKTEELIRSSGIAWTIFRPTHFMESLPMFLRGGKAELMLPQPQRYRYIAAEDYARQVVRAFESNAAVNRAFLMIGPEAFSMEEALMRYLTIVHPDVRMRKTPLWLLRLVARATGNAALQHATMLFDAFRHIPETGDPAATHALLGYAGTTLERWCKARIT